MPRGESRWRRAAYVILAYAVPVLAAGATWALYILAFRIPTVSEMDAWLEASAASVLNRDVSLEITRISIFPHPVLTVSSVVVPNLTGSTGPPLLEVERMRIRVSRVGLFRGRLDLVEVEVERPTLRLTRDDDGITNYGDFVPTRRGRIPNTSGLPIRFLIARLDVDGGILRVEDAVRAHTLTVDGIDASLSLEADPGDGDRLRWILEGHADSLRAAPHSRGSAPVHRDEVRRIRVVGTLTLPGPGGLVIQEGRVDLSATSVSLSDAVATLLDPARTAELSSRVPPPTPAGPPPTGSR